VFYSGAGPIAGDIYTLTSECKCGIQYVVRIKTCAAGLTRGITAAGQHITFDDFHDCPSPDSLVGDYFNVGSVQRFWAMHKVPVVWQCN
jgi:hypothetical protein